MALKKYELLEALLPLLEQYELQQRNASQQSVQDFLEWAQEQKNDLILPSKENSTKQEAKTFGPQGDQTAQISQLIALMYKYLKFYFKKISIDTPLSSVDDFGMLATLWIHGDLRKNELIEQNTLEFTSGMEVIRRLERNQLVDAYTDPEDARARRVRLTKEGQVVLVQILPKMQQIGRIALADLDDKEQAVLYKILNKLNDFHQPIFNQAKKEEIAEIWTEFFLKK